MENLKVLIGRSSQCDYTIENPEQHGTVSGKHATLTETGDQNVFTFEDHSTNGSYINGQLLHHCSCKVNMTDHITLGKTYILPLEDIVKRYFTSHRTTKKKNQPQPLINEPNMKIDEATYRVSSDVIEAPEPAVLTVEKVVEKVVEKEIEKVPVWYWVLYAVSIVIAFLVGFYMYYSNF